MISYRKIPEYKSEIDRKNRLKCSFTPHILIEFGFCPLILKLGILPLYFG